MIDRYTFIFLKKSLACCSLNFQKTFTFKPLQSSGPFSENVPITKYPSGFINLTVEISSLISFSSVKT